MLDWAVPICTVFEFLSVFMGEQSNGFQCLKVVVSSELLQRKAWVSLDWKGLERLKVCLWGAPAAAASSTSVSCSLCWCSLQNLWSLLQSSSLVMTEWRQLAPSLWCIWQLCLVCGKEDSTAYLEKKLFPSLGLQASHFRFSFPCLIS